jgi:hypothetical protein
VILDIPVYNQIVNVNLLNDNKLDSNHRPLTLSLNFILHKNPLENNSDNQIHFIFDKNKVDLVLKDLNTKLNLLSYKNNIEEIYHIFRTITSTSIKKFSIKVLCKKKNRIANPW